MTRFLFAFGILGVISTGGTGDCQAPQPRYVLRGHTDAVQSMAFDSTGTLLASASWDRTVRLWDTTSGKETGIFKKHSAALFCVAISADGKLVASGGVDQAVQLWDVVSHKVRVSLKPDYFVDCVACNATASLLVCGGGKTPDHGKITFLNTATGHIQTGSAKDLAFVHSVALSKDDTELASGSSDGAARIWDVKTAELKTVLRVNNWSVEQVAFSPDGLLLAAASLNGTVKVWDARSGREKGTLSGQDEGVTLLAFSSDGNSLIVAKNRATVWDFRTGREKQVLSLTRGERVLAVAFCTGKLLLASTDWSEEPRPGERGGTIKLWEVSLSSR